MPSEYMVMGLLVVRRLLAAVGGLCLGVLIMLVSPPAPASAHAILVDTNPIRGSVIAAMPSAVVLTFSENVRLVPGKVRVVAPDGEQVSAGEPSISGPVLTIPLRPAAKPLGTYTVSYRVISADSHPVAGGFSFSIGARSLGTQVTADPADPALITTIAVAKYLGYAGLTMIIGPVLVLAALWPRRLSRRGPARLIWTGVGLTGLSAVAAIWLQAPYAYGGGPLDASVDQVAAAAKSQFGILHLVRLGVLALAVPLLVLAIGKRLGRNRGIALAVLGTGGLITWPLTGHPVASPMPAATIISDVLHLASMALWLGGLIMLGLFLLPRADPRELRLILPAWSRWAALAVYCLVTGGLVQALVEVGGLRPLFATTYGQLVLVKAGLLAVVLAIAAFARLISRRQLAAGAPLRLRRMVSAELGLTALVLAASALVVQTTPGRSAGQEAAVVEPETYSRTLTSALYTLQFEIYPVQRGENNTLHAFVYTPEGAPIRVSEWKVTAALPSAAVEPIDTPIAVLQDSHGLGALNFPLPGDWLLRFTIRTSEIDQATVTATVSVP